MKTSNEDARLYMLVPEGARSFAFEGTWSFWIVQNDRQDLEANLVLFRTFHDNEQPIIVVGTLDDQLIPRIVDVSRRMVCTATCAYSLPLSICNLVPKKKTSSILYQMKNPSYI